MGYWAKPPYTAWAEDTTVGVFHSPACLKIPLGRAAIFQMNIALDTLRDGGFSGANELFKMRKSSGEMVKPI